MLYWRVLACTCCLGLVIALVGCRTSGTSSPAAAPITSSIPSSLQVPFTIERLAVLYPKTLQRPLSNAYTRLEGETFRLKEQRPSLRIIERSDLETLFREHQLGSSGVISEDSAIRLGRMLGVDSVLLYRIDGPIALRDRVVAKYYGDQSQVMVTSKIIHVESGELVFHNVVTVSMAVEVDPSFSLNNPYLPAALDRGVTQTIKDLQRAFR